MKKTTIIVSVLTVSILCLFCSQKADEYSSLQVDVIPDEPNQRVDVLERDRIKKQTIVFYQALILYMLLPICQVEITEISSNDTEVVEIALACDYHGELSRRRSRKTNRRGSQKGDGQIRHRGGSGTPPGCGRA